MECVPGKDLDILLTFFDPEMNCPDMGKQADGARERGDKEERWLIS